MKKRILQIIPTLDRAGAEKQMCLLARGLPPDEFDVRVCALTRGGPLLEDLRRASVPTAVIGKRCKFDPVAFWRLRQYIAEIKPDLVHTWIFAADAYGRAAAMLAGVPAMVTGLRCVDPWKNGLQLALDRLLARRTARLVANSPGVRDFYIEKGLPGEKIEVIPNAVEPAGPVRTTRRQILAELDLPDDSRLVGLVGRLWAQKRVKDAIWATDLLKVIRKDVHLLIVGDGPQRTQLVRYRDQIEIADKVHFLGERPDVARLLPHFDALWSTSGYEGQSNAVMEAMAAAVPVVATDVPGTRDLVVDGETGYLVPLGDRAGFARHTNRLLDDASLAARLGQAARDRMAEHFPVAAMIDRYADLYRRVLEK